MYSSDVPFTNGKYVHEKEYGWFSSPYSSLYKSNIISDSSSIHFFLFSFYSLIQSQKSNSISFTRITVLFSLFFITLSLLTSLFPFSTSINSLYNYFQSFYPLFIFLQFPAILSKLFISSNLTHFLENA